jgi:tRNA pseudouridine32 synthase/23S rRNA pseudouridine746 synthase
VHLQAIGHAIVGDRLYAPASASNAAPRLMLHAASLRFVHPLSGEPVDVRSAAPF